jgi:hypothetical protein
MPFPPKVIYATEGEYRQHFERIYCGGPVLTADGIPVHFRKQHFDHCMYESSHRNNIKDVFSKDRSERINWIKDTLENPDSELYVGWDKTKKRYDSASRVAVVYEEFVVVIRITTAANGTRKGQFVTAYLADNSIGKIRANPKWT